MTEFALKAKNLHKDFRTSGYTVNAVDDFSVDVKHGECLAIVGESGSGKSTIANMILGVHEPSSGQVIINGHELPYRRKLKHRRLVQLVQQNPLSSLNPRRSISATIQLALDVHNIGSPGQRRARVGELLEEVGLPDWYAKRPPEALSGGERQRVAIARALACESKLVVLDEPTSSLDVIVQSRVLHLLNELRSRRGLTYIFITHDLAVVCNIADRVAVLKDGKLVEMGDTGMIFTNPSQGYTRRLIAASPVVSMEEVEFRSKLRDREKSQ